MTDFAKNTIIFDKANNPVPPNKSTQNTIFYDGKEMKQIDFAGNVTPLVPPQVPQKVYNTTVEADSDLASFTFVVPNPNKIVKELEVALKQLIEGNKQEALSNFQETLATLKSYQDSQNSANGIFDSDLRDIENKISELISVVDTKVASSDFEAALSKLSSELVSLITNINNSLNLKATKKELESGLREVKGLIPKLPEPINIVAGSSNVDVTKENDTYTISVDIPKISQQVVQSGGGVSRAWVEKYVEENSGSGTLTTWGNIIGDIANQSDLQVALSNFTPLSTTSSISGNLQGQINSINVIGGQGVTVVESPTNTFTINVSGGGVSSTLSYNLDGTLHLFTSALGTKTMNYNIDGTLASISGTGQYQSKTFTYADGKLTNVTVS